MYNCIRVILEEKYSVYGCFIDNYDKERKEQKHVVKIIKYDEVLAINAEQVFTSYRNYEDIIASMKRRREVNKDERFANEARWENLNNYLINLLMWQSHSDYIMLYTTLEKHPFDVIGRIAQKLGVAVNVKRIKRKLDNLQIPKEGFNPVTLYHAGHRTNNNNV